MESASGSVISSSDESRLAPDSASSTSPGRAKKTRGREANVYDAVAG